MISLLQPRKSLFWALCIVLIVVRFGGAHWHLCYDGSEQPRALHIGEMEMHELQAGAMDAAQASSEHIDADLDLVESGLAKYFKSLHELPALLCAVALFFLLLPRHSRIPDLPLAPLGFSSLRHHPAAPRAPPR